MAPRVKAPSANQDSPLTRTDTPMNYGAFSVAPSAGMQKVSRGRGGAPNPLAGVVAKTLTQGPLKIDVADGKQAREVTSLLRQDKGDQNLRLSIQYQDGKGNVVELKQEKVDGKVKTTFPVHIREVHFAAKAGKTQRKYTAEDIRKWAAENNNVISGPVPAEVREAFKKAHGYAK